MTRALILGAANPIGCRLAEALCDHGVPPVALVDDATNAWRLARLPVRLVPGAVVEGFPGAMEGCDTVYHCAQYDGDGLDSRGRRWIRKVRSALASNGGSLKWAETLVRVAVRAGARRVICLNAAGVSTASERTLLGAHREHDLMVTVLRPATVYGPFCAWTIEAVRALRRGRRHRAGRGRVLYVDHLVEAMLVAAGCEAAAGRAFPLHDPEPASREELLEAHARALAGRQESASVTRAAVHGEPGNGADLEAARLGLGYEPTSTFAENMARTAAWIEWSRL